MTRVSRSTTISRIAGVLLEEREEAPIASARQDVALNDQNARLDLGLVSLFPRWRRAGSQILPSYVSEILVGADS